MKKIKEFLKPNIWEILIFLIITIPAVIYIQYPYPARILLMLRFFILKNIFNFLLFVLTKLSYFFMMVQGCSGDVGDINSCANDVNQTISLVLAFVFFFIISYIFSCLIVIVWKRLFDFLGSKKKLYESISLVVFIVLFLVLSVLLPLTGDVSIEKKFLSTGLNREKVFSSDGDFILQELTIKNNLILPVKYSLPDVTVCVFDVENKVAPVEYWIAYKDENGKYIEKTYESRKNTFYVITLGAKEEKKIYISDRIGLKTLNTNMFNSYKNEVDKLLFFETKNITNKNKYCEEITNEDIINAESVNILK